MSRRILRAIVGIAMLMSANHVRASDDLTPLAGPTLPMPTPTPQPLIMVMPSARPTGYYRPNRMDVWQYYAVDRNGGWKPRVAMTPYGNFTMYNGVPYYMLPIKQMDVIPYILD